jgi:hypothetical protein
MATSTVLAAIQSAATPYMPGGTTWKVGKEKVSNEDAAPRVIFAYGPDDEFQGARATRVTGMANPRPLMTRVAKMQAHLWGRTYDETEAMINVLLGAIYATALGSMAILSGGWTDPSYTAHGNAYVLTFSLEIPVTEAPATTGVATSLPQTVALQS